MDHGQNLLLSILNSKRLLSDHVEVLERALSDDCPKQWFTTSHNLAKIALPFSASVVSTIFLSRRWQIIRCIVPVATVGYYIVQLYCVGSYRLISKRLLTLLAQIDAYDVCIRRNIKYFREIAYLISTSELMQRQCSDESWAHVCILSIRQVIIKLFDCVRKLEANPLPPAFSDIYENMEDLSNCEYFQIPLTQMSTVNIKDFYNIYSYVQSQLLTRLGIMIAVDYDKAKRFINHDVLQLIDELNTHISNDLAAQTKITNTSETKLINTIHRKLASNRDEPLSLLRSYSLSFSSRILAVANECRNLDNIFQDSATVESSSKKEFHDLIGSMKHIEDSLSICTDDYKRLVLAYHKFLNIRYNDETAQGIDQNGSESNYASIDTKVFNENVTTSVEESEFFVLSERTEDDDEPAHKRRSNIDDEIRQIDAKVIKQHFKPVLRQLRDKIGPINKSMRDRERQFLEKQGIQTEDEPPLNIDSEDSETDSMSICRKRIQRKKNQYDEVRQFLQDKQQVSFLPPQGLIKMINEDILE